MSTSVAGRLILLCLLSVVAAGSATAGAPRATLPFGKQLDRALEEAADGGKPVAVVYVAAWCPLCRSMKLDVFPELAARGLSEEFVWVMVDIDRQLSLARERDVEGVPLLRVLGPDGSRRDSMLGLWPIDDLEARLRGGLDGGTVDPAVGEHVASRLTWRPRGYRGAGACFSQVGYGPLAVTAQSAFQSLRLGLRPRTPSTLGAGQFEVRASTTWSNFWAVDGEPGDPDKAYFLDFETLQVSAALAYGITDRFQVELELQDRSRFGGELDGLSQGFHDLFGIDQNGRDDVGRGLFVFELDPGGGTVPVALGPSDRGSFSRTAQLSFQHNVTCGTPRLPALSYQITARVETLDVGDLTGGGDLDVGFSISAARRLGRFYLYGTLGYAWFGRDRFRGIRLTDSQWTGLFAGEWRLRPKMSLVLQWLSTEGLIEGYPPFSESSDEFTFGFTWELRDRGRIELGIIENFISFDNTPDVGFHAGFVQRF